jgi:hypothetical protein
MAEAHEITLTIDESERMLLVRILEFYMDETRWERRRTDDMNLHDEIKREYAAMKMLADKLRLAGVPHETIITPAPV